MAELTPKAIERVMDEYDRLGEQAFLAKYRRGMSRDYWVVSPYRASGRHYVSKAIAAVALGWPDINGGYSQRDSACRVLERAGYLITDAGGTITEPIDEPDPSDTERDRLITERIGQEIFRERVLAAAGGCCEVTGVDEVALLRASHIKPWKQADNTERLDADDGVLLSALWDVAFDRGLVTFLADGMPLLSARLTVRARDALRVEHATPLELRPKRQMNLDWHRENWFLG